MRIKDIKNFNCVLNQLISIHFICVTDVAYAAGLAPMGDLALIFCHAHFYKNTPIFYLDMLILGYLENVGTG